jgi:hypothetical protein
VLKTHTEGRAGLASATHDLHRAERVHFVETVVDHNVNQHGARLARRTSTSALGAPHVIPALGQRFSQREMALGVCHAASSGAERHPPPFLVRTTVAARRHGGGGADCAKEAITFGVRGGYK